MGTARGREEKLQEELGAAKKCKETASTRVAEREGLVDGCLRSIIDELLGPVRSIYPLHPVSISPLTFSSFRAAVLGEMVGSSSDLFSAAKDCGLRASKLMASVADLLSHMLQCMYPGEEVPQLLGELVDLFRTEDDPLHDFSQA